MIFPKMGQQGSCGVSKVQETIFKECRRGLKCSFIPRSLYLVYTQKFIPRSLYLECAIFNLLIHLTNLQQIITKFLSNARCRKSRDSRKTNLVQLQESQGYGSYYTYPLSFLPFSTFKPLLPKMFRPQWNIQGFSVKKPKVSRSQGGVVFVKEPIKLTEKL